MSSSKLTLTEALEEQRNARRDGDLELEGMIELVLLRWCAVGAQRIPLSLSHARVPVVLLHIRMQVEATHPRLVEADGWNGALAPARATREAVWCASAFVRRGAS